MEKKIFEKITIEIIVSSNEILTKDLICESGAGPDFDNPNDSLNP